MKSLVFILFLPYVLGFELPFGVSALFFSKPSPQANTTSTRRIAIIGAGAGGSSAAFWISKAKERSGLDVQVDVYEAAGYVGGRANVVHPYDNQSLPALELGASIFIKKNKNLWRAAEEFGLELKNAQSEEFETGVWDGQEVLFSFSGSLWDMFTMFWRYGILSPRRTENAVQSLIDQMLGVYHADFPKWDSISNLVETLGWSNVLNSTARTYFSSQGVSDKYIFEVIEAATRVNYGQNADAVHGLAGAVCMAPNDIRAVEGGNMQIFEEFLNRSGANVYLNTKVESISGSSTSGWSLRSTRGASVYDAVILAAPFHLSSIVVPQSIAEQIPKQPYVHLHVTILTTTAAYPNPEYFGKPSGSKVPREMLTTRRQLNGESSLPEFSSLGYLGRVGDEEWAVKIFSNERISDEWLDNVFLGQVKWVTRKEWDAYPELPPTTNFPPVKLDQGFYYVNAFEPLISVMETQTVSSRNVVDLLLREEFDSGICPTDVITEGESQSPLFINATSSKSEENFVFGFDC